MSAVFPRASAHAAMYESFYVRLVAPDAPLGAWLRCTVERRPGAAPRGMVWCTVFDGEAPPFARRVQAATPPRVPDDGSGDWIALDDARIGPCGTVGTCGEEAAWTLRIASSAAPLAHLSRPWLYRAPLPRTKATSPLPAATFDGELHVGGRTIAVERWRGMVGHNWGAEHAERWIWLHGVAFAQDDGAWLDVVLGRVRVAGRLTPWVANGALALGDGRRLRLGGLLARGVTVEERPDGVFVRLPVAPGRGRAGGGAAERPTAGGRGGAAVAGGAAAGGRGGGAAAGGVAAAGGGVVEIVATAPATAAIARWTYDDPAGRDGRTVANCSIAALAVAVREPAAPSRRLTTAHGGAWETGRRRLP